LIDKAALADGRMFEVAAGGNGLRDFGIENRLTSKIARW